MRQANKGRCAGRQLERDQLAALGAVPGLDAAPLDLDQPLCDRQPSPAPPVRLLRESSERYVGSKIRGRSSASMPGPSSAIVT